MNSKNTQDKRKISWKWILIAVLAVSIVGAILPNDEEKAETHEANSPVTTEVPHDKSSAKTENKATQKHAADEINPLTKDEVLAKFEVDVDTDPYINGPFLFVGNRKDTADYYVLADTDKYRNASVIFKDGEIAKVKLIPSENQDVEKLFEEFGITDKPRKLSGAAGAYEVALIPVFWSQNIEKYPFELD